MTPAEPQLDEALARIESIGDTANWPRDAASFSFGPGDFGREWADALGRLRAALDRCVGAISAFATIEEDAAGKSAVGWAGGLATVWSAGATPVQRQSHFDAVDECVRVRSKLVRIAAATIGAAAAVGVALSPFAAAAALAALLRLAAELEALWRVPGKMS